MSKQYPSATFRLTEPNQVEATMTLTLTLEQWQHVIDDLRTGKTAYYWIHEAIHEMLQGALQHFSAQDFDWNQRTV